MQIYTIKELCQRKLWPCKRALIGRLVGNKEYLLIQRVLIGLSDMFVFTFIDIVKHLRSNIWVRVFNTTLSNISVMSWWSVLLVEEKEYPNRTTNLPQVIDKLYHVMYRIHIVIVMRGIRGDNTDCIRNFKSSYHTITHNHANYQ